MNNVTDVQILGEKEPGVFEYSVEGPEGKDIRRDLFAFCSRKGAPLLAMRSTDLTLEEVLPPPDGRKLYESGKNAEAGPQGR